MRRVFFCALNLERIDCLACASRLSETLVRLWPRELFTSSICNAHATGYAIRLSLTLHRIGNGHGNAPETRFATKSFELLHQGDDHEPSYYNRNSGNRRVFVLTLAFAPTELSPSREALVVDAQCTRTCQGDFPAPTNRKYAEANEMRYIGPEWPVLPSQLET